MSRTWGVLILAAACGGSGGKAADAPDHRIERGDGSESRDGVPDVEDGPDDGMEVSGLKGHIEPYEINKGIQSRGGEFNDCHVDQLSGRGWLGGQVKLKFAVNPEGAVDAVFVMEGDLGSWAVERCLLEVARGIEFARPKGGDRHAEFDIDLTFPARRATMTWDEDTVDKEVAKLVKELGPCTPAPEETWVTLYVGTRGKVLSAGFSGHHPLDPAWADCAAAAIGKWTVSDPRGQVAKGSFRYSP